MMVDGIFFSHGGAADLPHRSVMHNFGIIADHSRVKHDDYRNALTAEKARMAAYRQLAAKAANVGANAVLNVQINLHGLNFGDTLYWEAPITGDAVTLGDEE